MDQNLKARVEATMRIPRWSGPCVVEDGIVRDLRLLYEYATALEVQVERLRQIVRAEGADPDVYCPGGLSKPELRAECERLRREAKVFDGEAVFHRCGGSVYPYPALMCSRCMGKGEDENAFDMLRAALSEAPR